MIDVIDSSDDEDTEENDEYDNLKIELRLLEKEVETSKATLSGANEK